MVITKKNLEKLFNSCQYDPEDIGIALLKALGYKVEIFMLSCAVYVFTKDGKKILFADSGAYVD